MKAQDARVAAALRHRCPFCQADPGEPCRTRPGAGREGGKEQPWPHSRRRDLAEPIDHRYVAVQVDALCCVCGSQRTVNSDYHRYSDPNYAEGEEGKQQGWRRTQTLKCAQCGRGTRHAILYRADDTWRDRDERFQRIALGGENTNGWSDTYVEQLRREYHHDSPFPRNPNLHHRFYIEAATEAWDTGKKTVTALCGATDTIGTDPRTWGKPSKKKSRQNELYDGYVVAEQLSDIEYTDPDTGLEWIDMDCVDCCRVSNHLKREQQRERLRCLLVYLAGKPELIDDTAVGDLVKTLQGMYDRAQADG